MSRPLCFVLMWFDEQMDDAYDSIKQVAEELGYDCRRADDVLHVGQITAVVKDQVRQASVLVADLTGCRPNVYYEIGYADALGRPVILACREGESIEFALQGLTTILYRTERQLRQKLKPMMVEAAGTAPQPPRAALTPEPDEADEELQRTVSSLSGAIAKEPENAELYHSRAMLLRALGRDDEAAADFMQTLKLAPGDVAVYLDFAYFLNGLRRFEQSLEVTESVLRLDPTNVKALCLRAYALNGMRRYEEALGAAGQALELEPQNPTAQKHFDVARSSIRESEGGFARSENGMGTVEELLALGYSLNNAGDYRAALRAYEEAVKTNPLSIAAHIGHGYTLNRLRRPAEAVQAYDRAIALDPDHAGAHTQRGFTLNALGRFDEAAAAARRALDIGPGSRAALRVLSAAVQHLRP